MTEMEGMMFLKVPDKEGWWIAISPQDREVFVFVGTVCDNVMSAWMPMNVVLGEGPPGASVIVYFEDGKSPKLIKKWRWREIEIPSYCPHFDDKED